MSSWPFRFLHASDLHLERPPEGVTEIPDHLQQAFVDAPIRAAQRVVDAALSEEVDFVILSGDVLGPHDVSPRVLLSLVEQFERLNSRGIQAYWCGGTVDPVDRWPRAVRLPDNVHRFPQGGVDEFAYQRDGAVLARILGQGQPARRRIRAADYHTSAAEPFTIVAAYGTADAAELKASPIDYWALGGRHNRKTLFAAARAAHYSGSPQGRSPTEPGPHGCTVVQVDQEGRSRLRLLSTDCLRWHQETVTVDESMTRDEVQRQLFDRAAELREESADVDLLIHWTLAGCGPAVHRAGRGLLAAELLGGLRSEFPATSPAAWNVSLEIESSASIPPDSGDDDTILGEFLHSVRNYQEDDSLELDLDLYLTERQVAGTLAASLAINDSQTRTRVLRQAAELAVELLSGEEPQS